MYVLKQLLIIKLIETVYINIYKIQIFHCACPNKVRLDAEIRAQGKRNIIIFYFYILLYHMIQKKYFNKQAIFQIMSVDNLRIMSTLAIN